MTAARGQTLDLNLLRVLDALVRERSVTRAARRVGLSTSALSHALARLRVQLGDPLFVRGRDGLVPTERAAALGPVVTQILDQLDTVVRQNERFDPAQAVRTFRIGVSDYAAILVLPTLERLLAAAAPGVDLVAIANGDDLMRPLSSGAIDLALDTASYEGPGLHARTLLDERFVCVVRKGHPGVARRLTLETYLSLRHVLVSPRGTARGAVDRELAALGHKRRIHCIVPHFAAAPYLVSQSDCVLTSPERIARAFAAHLPVRVLAPPLALPGFRLRLYWHGSSNADPAHQWLRARMVEAAAAC